MACHIFTSQKRKGMTGNAITQSESHIQIEFRNGIGLRLGKGISPCFFAF